MSELLRVLTQEDVDDEPLQEAAAAAHAVLEARGVDVEGVAPVLHEGAGEAGQQAIDDALADGGVDETVEIPADVARTARRELGILISETDAPEEGGQPMTPTARIRQRLEEELPHDLAVQAVDIVDAVAEETGATHRPVDPLQDDIFRAKDALADVLGEDDDD